jgi:hypothetical protein
MATTVANDAFGRLRVGLPETLHDSRVTLGDIGLLPLPLTLNAAGSSPVNFSLVVTSVSGTANVAAAMTWTEVR